MKRFNLELILFDTRGKSDIHSIQGLVHGLLYSDKLWKSPSVNYADAKSIIQDGESKINLVVYPWLPNEKIHENIKSAFRLRVLADSFEELETFRGNLIHHLKRKLDFTHIRLLTDDVSTHLCNEVYPLINKVENALRKYLVKFFLQEKGLGWWKTTASKELDDKIRFRKRFGNAFSNLLDQDVNLIDFNELGELIFKKSNDFYNENTLIEEITGIEKIEELNLLKEKLQGNYTRYFKQTFRDYKFEKKWKALLEIRNKVAHNSFLTIKDLHDAEILSRKLIKIITRAELFINADNNQDLDDDNKDISMVGEITLDDNADRLKRLGVKVVGQIDLEQFQENGNKQEEDLTQRIISEEEMLLELAEVEEQIDSSELRYIGLKTFITKVLAQKGYAIGPSYALINSLAETEKIDIYDYEDDYMQYPVKAIRLNVGL